MESKKDAQLNEEELNSVTGGTDAGDAWDEMMRRNCAGRTTYNANWCGNCRSLSWVADGSRNNQLFKHCHVLNIFLE